MPEEKIITVLRVIRYTGPENAVMRTLKNSINDPLIIGDLKIEHVTEEYLGAFKSHEEEKI